MVAGIYRTDTNEFVIPRGDRKLKVNDRLFLVADTADIRRAATYLGAKAPLRKL
jgi:Trk K+ transport system NAD-binding subunit